MNFKITIKLTIGSNNNIYNTSRKCFALLSVLSIPFTRGNLSGAKSFTSEMLARVSLPWHQYNRHFFPPLCLFSLFFFMSPCSSEIVLTRKQNTLAEFNQN